RGAPAPPPPLAAELGLTRVRPPIDRPKSDKSDFGLEGQGGGMRQDSRVQAHPLPNPPPPGAPRDAPRRGDPVAGEGAHRVRGEGADRASRKELQSRGSAEGQSAYFVWLNRGKESLVLDLARTDDKALLAAILAKADV